MRLLIRCAALFAAVAMLAGCSATLPTINEADRVPDLVFEDEVTRAPSRSGGEDEDDWRDPNMPVRPKEAEYELVELQPEMYFTYGINDRGITFKGDVPTSEAGRTVANAWLCEVSGEFWRWEYLCETPIRTPTVAMNYVDALMKDYAGGYGYQSITVHRVSQLSAEQLYTTTNTAGDALLLQPYYDQALSVLPFEQFVEEFVAAGNKVVIFSATLQLTETQAEAEGIELQADEDGKIKPVTRELLAYYLVKKGGTGHDIIKNSTQEKGGAFFRSALPTE